MQNTAIKLHASALTDGRFADMIVKCHGDIPAETVSYDSASVEVRSRTCQSPHNQRIRHLVAIRQGTSVAVSGW